MRAGLYALRKQLRQCPSCGHQARPDRVYCGRCQKAQTVCHRVRLQELDRQQRRVQRGQAQQEALTMKVPRLAPRILQMLAKTSPPYLHYTEIATRLQYHSVGALHIRCHLMAKDGRLQWYGEGLYGLPSGGKTDGA